MTTSHDTPVGESDPEPEPLRHWRYINSVLHVSRRIENDSRYGDWISDSGDSRVTIQPKRICAEMAGKAFRNYVDLTVGDKHDIEHIAQGVMTTLHDADDNLDMRVLLNYVPLLFTNGENAVIGKRERDGTNIVFDSDKLRTPERREILVGGLATILYYADFPLELRRVE